MRKPSSFVELKNIKKTYPAAVKPAVNGLSLNIQAGEILALLGPNGAGKTTTVKIIAGLVLPSSGVVNVMGRDMLRERGQGIRHIGAVLEGARNLYWRMSARDNLLYFGGLRRVPRGVLSDRVDELLALFNLKDRQHQEVRHYSRGMQQKLALAAAMVHDPSVLLLDEPTLGLDVMAARQLEETIVGLAERGKAVLLTTHIMDLAERLANNLLILHQGSEVDSGDTHELLDRYNTSREAITVQVADLLDAAYLAEVEGEFPGIQATLNANMTVLAHSALNQSELLRLLQVLNDGAVNILSVERRRVRLEEVFLQLTQTEEVSD